jgi:hypothetical protein
MEKLKAQNSRRKTIRQKWFHPVNRGIKFPFREGVARSDGVVQRWDRRKTKAEGRKLKTEIISTFCFRLSNFR